MKTLAKLMYVEADEEITDLVDRLRDASLEDAVTFVVPERSRALQSPMSFRLLKRYADSYGKHVNVISGDARLQALSLETGFSAYPSLLAYDSGAEVHRPRALESDAATAAAVGAVTPAAPVRHREAPVVSGVPKRSTPPPRVNGVPPSLRSYKPYLIGAGAIAVLALLALVFYIPTAAVTLSVRGTPVSTDIQLLGAPGTVSGSADHFSTQAIHASESQTVQGTATGQKQVAAVAATGNVTFTLSCFLCTENLPKGLAVRTDGGKRYVTQRAVTMSGPFGSSTVPVRATAGGGDGNTDSHTVTTIEGNTDDNLKVDNAQPIGGGADARTATTIQQSDIDSIVTAYAKDAVPKVQGELAARAPGLRLVPVGDGVKPSFTADHKVGDELQSPFTFNVTATVAGDAVGFDEKAVKALLHDALIHKVPRGSQLTDNPSISYDQVGATADGNLTLNGHATGSYTPVFLETAIRGHLKGKTASSARAFLQSLPNVVDARISQAPYGLPWLPLLSSRISLKIQEVAGSPTP